MEMLRDVLDFMDGYLGSAAYFPILLLLVGVWFTFYLGVPQVRYFKRAFETLQGKHTRSDAEGDTTHFQALSTALSGTIGTGNIGGVAFAIFLGGPAALFWMWATAFVGMTTKFVEVTISHKYRVKDRNGQMAGGPMYFMEHGMNAKWLAVFFAIATVISSLGSGNLPQSNNMAAGLEASLGIPPWITGLVLALVLGLVIIGGIRRIAAVASRIVPFMGVLYAVGALAVVIANYDMIIPSFLTIFADAFSGSAAVGGFLGATFAYAFNRGVNRGLFSNEAGQGSAPIAHASAKGDEPVSEGMVSILEPFIDTLVICTLTGLVILSSGVWAEKFENEFENYYLEFVEGQYDDDNPEDVDQLFRHLAGRSGADVSSADGTYPVVNGVVAADITVIHNRSIAENVVYYDGDERFSGDLVLEDGQLVSDLTMRGESLLHSVPLTAEAFKRSFFGEFGQYAVTIGLVLFAFSTALAWSYYGDRAMVYLFGIRWVMPYRIVYVIGFFLATIVDTSLVWLISAVTLALMALPNLIGILWMSKEMKETIADYWRDRES